MNKLFLIILLLLLIGNIIAQVLNQPKVDPYHPQSKRFWNKEGKYQMITSMSKSSFAPGDSTDIQVFFTGYGLNEDLS